MDMMWVCLLIFLFDDMTNGETLWIIFECITAGFYPVNEKQAVSCNVNVVLSLCETVWIILNNVTLTIFFPQPGFVSSAIEIFINETDKWETDQYKVYIIHKQSANLCMRITIMLDLHEPYKTLRQQSGKILYFYGVSRNYRVGVASGEKYHPKYGTLPSRHNNFGSTLKQCQTWRWNNVWILVGYERISDVTPWIYEILSYFNIGSKL